MSEHTADQSPGRLGHGTHLFVPVDDLGNALAFYANGLGYTVKFRDSDRFALLSNDAHSLALAAGDETLGLTAPGLMVRVADVEQAAAELLASGGTVLSPPISGEHETRAAAASADGTPLVLYTPNPRPGPPDDPSPKAPASRVDPDAFRGVMGHFASGVTVITVRHEGREYGITANAVSSLSLEPPMLLVCLNLRSTTQQAVAGSRSFVVNILRERQSSLAQRFAQRRSDKFDGVPTETGTLGHPVLVDVLAHLECEVVEDLIAGTHRVFLAEVVDAKARSGAPLAYFRGIFGRFGLAQDDGTHDHLRRLVLGREMPLDERLDPAALAGSLSVPISAVHYGLARMVSEGLVVRDPEHGYLQRALDAETADAAFAAKLVIDLGVADIVDGRADPRLLAELTQRADLAAQQVSEGRITDVDAYIKASVDFQEGVIRLADNPLLVEAYRRLSIAEIVAPALAHHSPSRTRLVEGRRQLVDAYAAGDVPMIRDVIMRQYELARDAQRAAIEHAGGRL